MIIIIICNITDLFIIYEYKKHLCARYVWNVLYPEPVYGKIHFLGNRTYWYATCDLCVYHIKRTRFLEILSSGVFTAAVRKFFLNPLYTVEDNIFLFVLFFIILYIYIKYTKNTKYIFICII